MNTYKVVKIHSFLDMEQGEEKSTKNSTLMFPGFLPDAITQIKFISKNYHGFEYYEIEHEMLFKEVGIAYGFYEEKPISLEFQGYKKPYTVKLYYKRGEDYGYISQNSQVVKSLIKKFQCDTALKIKIEEIEIDLNKASSYVQEYNGVWFKGVSTRVSSSALFGADLNNDSLFEQIQSEGASLTSIIIPFEGYSIQINKEASISSQYRIDSIQNELALIDRIKTKLIDKIIM